MLYVVICHVLLRVVAHYGSMPMYLTESIPWPSNSFSIVNVLRPCVSSPSGFAFLMASVVQKHITKQALLLSLSV